MATFRIQKTKDYTVMSNHHLQNKNLSLRAKGLLSQMLSLPEDWDYTLKGLAAINQEGIDAIRVAVNELEKQGYLKRERERDENGCLRGTCYFVYEVPIFDSPTLENPTQVKPTLEKPTLVNPTQLNTNIINKLNKLNTDLTNTHCTYTPEFQNVWSIYPRKTDKTKAYRVYCQRLGEGFSADELETAVKRYIEFCETQGIQGRYVKCLYTFFGEDKPFEDYLASDYAASEKSENPKTRTRRAKDSFNNFCQREYNFGEYEKMLLKMSCNVST